MSTAASISVECSGCHCTLKAPGDSAGKRIRCPKCKTAVAVPAPAASPVKPAKPASIKIACPDCGNPLRLPADFPPGKKAKCTVCSNIFEPRLPGAAPPAPASRPAVPPPAAVSAPTAETDQSMPTAPTDPGLASDPAALGEPQVSALPPYPTSSSGFRNEYWPLVKLLMVPVLILFLACAGVYSLFFSGPSGPYIRRVYAAEGQVTHNGKPAVGAIVTLVPEEQSKDHYRPSGTSDNEGKFTLTTYTKDDGAPVGRYRVAILWAGPDNIVPIGPEKIEPKASPELEITKDKEKGLVMPWVAMQEAAAKKPKVKRKGQPEEPVLDLERYANPDNSGFVVEIKSAANKLEFDLK